MYNGGYAVVHDSVTATDIFLPVSRFQPDSSIISGQKTQSQSTISHSNIYASDQLITDQLEKPWHQAAVGEKVTDGQTLCSALTDPVLPVTSLHSDGFLEGNRSQRPKGADQNPNLLDQIRGYWSSEEVKVGWF